MGKRCFDILDAQNGVIFGDVGTPVEGAVRYTTASGFQWYTTLWNTVGVGTVTGVGLVLPAEFTTGTAVNTSGNLSATWANQTAGKVFASPAGATGTPGFRALAATDIPNLDVAKIITGTFTFDRVATGVRLPCAVAATTTVSIASAPATIDGYTLVTGDRVLLTGQSNPQQNGPYTFSGVGAALVRPLDFPSGSSAWAFNGALFFVENGTANGGTMWYITAGGLIDTANLTFTQFLTRVGRIVPPTLGGTGLSAYTAGDTLYASASNTLSVLAGNGTATAKFLQMVSGVPSWVIGPQVFTGASSSVAGSTGLVPQPTAGQQDTFLTGASVWRLLLATDIPDILQRDQIAAPSVPVEGNEWNDSTQKCSIAFMSGVKQFDVRTMFISTADGTISNTATETTLFGTGIGTKTAPANFWSPGKSARLRLRGLLQFSGSGSGGTVRVKLGSTVIAVSSAMVFSGSSASPGTYFEVDLVLTCRTIGASGTFIAQGTFGNQILATPAGIIASAAVTVNTTVSQVIDATFQWTNASATRIITCTNAILEIIG